MSNIPERINQILKFYHLTATEFAEKLGVQKSSLSHLLSGRNKPSFQFMNKLAKAYPDINLEWFVTGEGDMLKNNHHVPKYAQEKPTEISPEPPITDTHQVKDIKKTDEKESSVPEVENIIMVYADNTFKILKKSR